MQGDIAQAQHAYTPLTAQGKAALDATETSLETLSLLLGDANTRDLLMNFPKRYLGAHSSVEQTRMAGIVALDILLVLAGAVAGGALAAMKHSAHLTQASELFSKLAAVLKSIKHKKTVNGHTDQRRIEVRADEEKTAATAADYGYDVGGVSDTKVLTKAERFEIQLSLQARVDDIRAELPKKLRGSGNAGVAQLDIPGLPAEIEAHSRINYSTDKGADGFVHLADESNWIFKPKAVDPDNVRVDTLDAYTRQWDTEFKILNDVALRLGDNRSATGSINLFTERLTCTSCTDVIFNFKDRYPNIQLNVFTGE